jgi:hypothetical protein
MNNNLMLKIMPGASAAIAATQPKEPLKEFPTTTVGFETLSQTTWQENYTLHPVCHAYIALADMQHGSHFINDQSKFDTLRRLTFNKHPRRDIMIINRHSRFGLPITLNRVQTQLVFKV